MVRHSTTYWIEKTDLDFVSHYTSTWHYIDNSFIKLARADASVAEMFYGLKRVNLHVSDSGMIEAPLSKLQQNLSIITTVSNHVFDRPMNMTFLSVNSNLYGILIVKTDVQHIVYEGLCKFNELKLV